MHDIGCTYLSALTSTKNFLRAFVRSSNVVLWDICLYLHFSVVRDLCSYQTSQTDMPPLRASGLSIHTGVAHQQCGPDTTSRGRSAPERNSPPLSASETFTQRVWRVGTGSPHANGSVNGASLIHTHAYSACVPPPARAQCLLSPGEMGSSSNSNCKQWWRTENYNRAKKCFNHKAMLAAVTVILAIAHMAVRCCTQAT